jgi:hypothetical protein
MEASAIAFMQEFHPAGNFTLNDLAFAELGIIRRGLQSAGKR